MKHFARQQACVTLVSLLLCVGGARAAGEHWSHAGSFTPFEKAERHREALESGPISGRTRAAYQRILAEYRAIYQAHPEAEDADAAMDAEASLLAEEGRSFGDPKLLRASVDQYELLRQSYPASEFRQSALLSEAEIEQSDLHEYATAHATFAQFLKQYPHGLMAAEARQQLRALNYEEGAHEATSAPARRQTSPPPAPGEMTARPLARTSPANTAPGYHAMPEPADPSIATGSPVARHATVTGIRHWSTSVYTRVAIDLTDQVQYEAARVPDPDRIYFDLHGARLSPELQRQAVDLEADGFLRRIRLAQSPEGYTRIVLDVSHVSEFSAFFLPNPWRLIIDIHGSGGAPSAGSVTMTAASPASPPQPGLPSHAARSTGRSSSLEITSLADAPNRVNATRRPTTGPIATQVSGTARAPQPNELDALEAAPPLPGSANGGLNLPGPVPDAVPASKPVRRRSSTTPPGAVTTNTVATALTPETPNLAAREASPTLSGERSLVRVLGLKIGRIVIDAGHGGHDSGTLGVGGLEEKDVVLDVALRLGKLLKQRLGADVIYTRDDDTFVPLETRTAIANKAQADLFISVHANSSPDPSARGVEVYYLNFTTSPDALEVAARENAVSNQSIYQLSDLVKKITLKDKIDESHEFASDVEGALYQGLEPGNSGLKDRGVKKAPFVVLIGANMPSILAEISFLTNPEDAAELREPVYRQRIAESLYEGIARYASGLSGMRLAQNSHSSNR